MSNRKRRGRQEGSIYFRDADQRWVGTLSLGYDDKGKRKRRTVYGETKKEVQEKLRQLQNDHSTGILVEPQRLSVAQYMDRWLENTAKPRVQPKTHLRYEQLSRIHVKPYIGGVRLDKLAPLHVEQLFAALERKAVSPRVRQMTGTMLHTALRDAVRLKLIAFNPSADVAKAKPKKPEMQVFTPEQVSCFLTAAKEDRLYALYVLAIDSGMRQGELFGLQWADIDFPTGVLTVRRSLEEINGKLRLKEPKSGRGRLIHLSSYATDALNEHRKAMLAEGHFRSDAPVFCDGQGGYLRKGNVLRRSYWPIYDRANATEAALAEKENRQPVLLPVIRFHDLRHSCATLLLLEGENVKVVSERLGHASVQLTLDTYSHALPTMQKGAAAKMDCILKRQAN
jgi:integrase